MAIRIVKAKIFPDEVIAGFTERNPEFPPFGLTFAISKFANRTIVRRNFHLLAEQLGFSPSKIFSLHQIHSDIVHIVDTNYKSKYGDALITNMKNCIIGVKIADCAGLLIYDPIQKVISAVHSGWRGTYKQIVPKTIEKMYQVFGSNPNYLLVFITALASVENYEVGKEFKNLFFDSVFSRNGKYYFDNQKEILRQLITTGVNPENIEVSNLCTIANKNLHSFRRDGEKSGRMFAFIGLKD